MVLVNGFEAWIETAKGAVPITSQLYGSETGDVLHPDGCRRLEAFGPEPWPCWRFRLEDGTSIEQELFARNAADAGRPTGSPADAGLSTGSPSDAGSSTSSPSVCLSWRCHSATAAATATLNVRLLFSGRDYHALHYENGAFRFEPERHDERLTWRPYDDLPSVIALTNGTYVHDPLWYRNFVYEEERARGLEFREDLASPGILRYELTRGPAILVLEAGDPGADETLRGGATEVFGFLRAAESQRRAAFPSRLHRSADAYLVRRGQGRTIIAGYPWFTDWGRDTFIALGGLCLATGRLEDGRDILLEWAGAASAGMMPNRFPDRGESPEYNSVDASLWYGIAVHDFWRAAEAAGYNLTSTEVARLQAAVRAILKSYAAGTRFGIRMDEEGLLCAGEKGSQVTWMDARVGDRAVTPRIGKPVEVQALWLNALWVGSTFGATPSGVFERARQAFERRFWNESAGCLYDVVDVDHEPGKLDATFRPNQIFAVGGLPMPLLEGQRARQVVDAVEARLWTPLGLRSLAAGEPGYAPRFTGDSSYHQGTVWPWLLGAFVDAWVRVRGQTQEVREEARRRFLAPLLEHLDTAGLGHISEIADAEPPHTPRGCPFQAWSLGEVLRIQATVLAEKPEVVGRSTRLPPSAL
jgi:predicted glycogen debranching enzyme